MKTIEIYEVGDEVYFLSNTEGFVKGWIKSIEANKNNIFYRVNCDGYNREYLGDLKSFELLFRDVKTMLNYYSKNIKFTNNSI